MNDYCAIPSAPCRERALCVGRGRLLALCLAGLALLLPGCMQEQVKHDGWGWLRDSDWADKPRPAADSTRTQSATPANRGGWAIQLATYEGRNRQKMARELVRLVQKHSRMPEVWVEDVANPGGKPQTRVLTGRYLSGDDWGALEDLNHLRQITVGDAYPLAQAELIPLGDKLSPGDNPYDLKRYVGMYTLQIGFYDDAAGPEFRKLAEQAVKSLRDKGEQAYFYHGPHRALICLGLFTENDFAEVSGTRTYGPRIKALQERFPNNLANGYTMVEKQHGQVLGEQPSFLVRVF